MRVWLAVQRVLEGSGWHKGMEAPCKGPVAEGQAADGLSGLDLHQQIWISTPESGGPIVKVTRTGLSRATNKHRSGKYTTAGRTD